MNAHLLTLADLHAAAPGVLDVVFGPDGDFEGAPPWAGPLTSLADPSRRGWLVWRGALHVSVATSDGHWPSTVEQWRERWSLDLRIPTVAARMAGLCARAMHGSPGSWTVLWLPECPGFALMGHVVLQGIPTTMGWWWSENGGRAGPMTAGGMGPPVRVSGATSFEHFLAALTLALAPRIAALKDAK